MAEDLTRIWDKLDTIIEKTGGVEEQFKTLNGSVARLTKKDQDHDNNFKDVYEEFKKVNAFNYQMKGGLIALGFVITCLIAVISIKGII